MYVYILGSCSDQGGDGNILRDLRKTFEKQGLQRVPRQMDPKEPTRALVWSESSLESWHVSAHGSKRKQWKKAYK